ncbi:response regulator transcription factor [Actinoplanes utahensis]|uniref:response regulator transcription factor n=1 Tax=Actinoplanes utahensis TaxID=1869 RepID=UPI00068A3C0D|nr:response regulator transcription factor [Actinoplanes utahensis]GIF33547.1 hypothetical protein Aut01nite_65330 [Actinoplanes utahensis]
MADVLIAENVPDIKDILERIFRRDGHAVRVTGDGREALDCALQTPPDLLVMNPALPGMDGLVVCRRLRAAAHTRHVPILLLSVRQYPAEQEAARRAGADDYLGKPFANKELLARAHALLDRPGGHTAIVPSVAMTD